MIDYATFQRIQHLHRVEQLTAAQIALAMAMDARTVRRWLDEPQFRARATPARPSKLDPYKAYIRRLLEHHPYSAAQILNRLREAGYVGGATIVKDYLQRVRPVRAPAFLTLHFAPGECAQVDWGHYGSVPVGNNPAARNWLDSVANVRVHGETHKRPLDLFALERDQLRPLPEPSALHLTRRADLLELELPKPDLSLYDLTGGPRDDTP